MEDKNIPQPPEEDDVEISFSELVALVAERDDLRATVDRLTAEIDLLKAQIERLEADRHVFLP